MKGIDKLDDAAQMAALELLADAFPARLPADHVIAAMQASHPDFNLAYLAGHKRISTWPEYEGEERTGRTVYAITSTGIDYLIARRAGRPDPT